jgi:hypothetical protein
MMASPLEMMARAPEIIARRTEIESKAPKIVPRRPGTTADALVIISSANAVNLAASTIVASPAEGEKVL